MPVGEWDPPWPPDDDRPLVVVSLGTTYMEQEAIIGRVVEAVDGLPVRGLVLTGSDLAPEEVRSAANVEVRDYVPHSAALRDASLVVTHAGTGTLHAAFSARIPVLCIPLGRDQPANARRVAQLGLGRVLTWDAPAAEIRAAIAETLASTDYREQAARMASIIEGYESGAPAMRMLESLAA